MAIVSGMTSEFAVNPPMPDDARSFMKRPLLLDGSGARRQKTSGGIGSAPLQIKRIIKYIITQEISIGNITGSLNKIVI